MTVAILAAGEFPKRGGRAWDILASASAVICCDGAADSYRRRMRREPFAVVGDCDSLRGRFKNVVKVPEQDTNDLEKAVAWCRERGMKPSVVLGATGLRDDHSIGNVFRALDLGLEVVTDCGRFIPVEGRKSLSVAKGADISVFAPDPSTRMKSRGLEWPLDGVKFRNLYCATLNRAKSSRVTVESDRRVYVYIAFGHKPRET